MNTAIVGLQWGDEGKGKVVDHLCRDFDINCRYQGGPNAGHTVWRGDRKLVFHQIPCGVLHENITAVVGAGCVLDPEVFFKELDELREQGYQPELRIKVSRYCHLVMPYHILLDNVKEETTLGIGTTKRGIGIAYEDKYARVGLRVGDLYEPESFERRLRTNVTRKNLILMDIYQSEPLSDGEVYDRYMKYAARLKPMVVDDSAFVNEAWRAGKRVLFEGAQGVLLDIDFGTYPFVTSSHTGSGGVSIGLGIAPGAVQRVVGVAKAYTTRVGQGPFPTEEKGVFGERLRNIGSEFGATTGRPRRCGWFDAAVVKYAARITGAEALFLTKLDVLAGFETLKICVGYANSREFDPFIADRLEPVYESVPGFTEDISKIADYASLPEEAREYIKLIEHYTDLPVTQLSVGKGPEAVITRS